MSNYITTPVGEVVGFVALETASTKFDEAGVYSCKLEFSNAADVRMMKGVIDDLMADSLAASGKKKSANPPYTLEDGKLTVNFKTKAKITCRDGSVIEKTIKFYDAEANLVTEPMGIGAGSKLRMQVQPYKWNVASAGAGVTLQPISAQVVELVTYSGAAPTNGFTKVDGGFVSLSADAEVKVDPSLHSTGDDVPF